MTISCHCADVAVMHFTTRYEARVCLVVDGTFGALTPEAEEEVDAVRSYFCLSSRL